MNKQPTAYLAAIEYHLPAATLTNQDLEHLYPGWPADKILDKTGIRLRHVASPAECSSDLGFEAARKLLERQLVPTTDIDLLLFCTQTPDYCLPTSACILQHRLGLPTSCAAFDFNLGCSGFVYGLSIANAYIRSGLARNVLLITGETYTKLIHPLDKAVRTIFGE